MYMSRSLTLPCGAELPNRLCKAAMTEGVADERLRATDRHAELYGQWSDGGAGLLLTGNVMIDRRVLERPGNVAIDRSSPPDDTARAALRRWAQAGTRGGNHLWMQISHAGRQSPRYVTGEPLAPSEVGLKILGNYARPRALRDEEIRDFIERFAFAAEVARDSGFTGVQVHAAHGYLLSSFLSPETNRRTDEWGGSLENRARMLLETVRAIRRTVGPDFPIAVKLNSDDFRKGGFSHEDCLQVVELLNAEGIDLLEISGGTYEQPRLLGFEGQEASVDPNTRESTRKREAYFIDYAQSIRRIATMPLMVTGGFRTPAFVEEVLAAGHCDVVGLGRPMTTDMDLPKRWLAGEEAPAIRHEQRLKLSDRRWLSGASPIFFFKILNIFGAQAWYYQQLQRIAAGRGADMKMGLLGAFLRYQLDELSTAWRVRRAAKR
ncbi:NADH:flavin oxidoreductase/NADH oxidase family protein [Algiphilus sp.]|uniref:NADH:flavin oxidoreductase/NADH oxidase family protein n=1 Tax=Algiphilus sp. TaxID=1872431 RepID=UPI0025B81659|nr:NADH:flavin oxidoreductase/NADH oxidase family protein [Algiphilus sp.]MCK5770001.1 NADH:flavin oxidoreductase/NADH oxidase family protein [Algiphilus sp.]